MEEYVAQVTSQSTARKRGVLVADGEPKVRDVLRVGLQQEGYSVWLAADGQEALDVYRNHCQTIDVVLLDVRMPVLDGPATLVAMQALTPEIPCCFMSGHLGRYTEEGLHRFGARLVLKKPFRLPEVAQLLRDVVDRVDLRPVGAAAERSFDASSSTERRRERDRP